MSSKINSLESLCCTTVGHHSSSEVQPITLCVKVEMSQGVGNGDSSNNDPLLLLSLHERHK